ncbi:hypothetical protein C8Q80DRAFT_1265436 [Daedaleopsis nitida]|nr:hypothetical protein C8Q80DRAFT_1265436 [Daedaleopsis nitida]
MSATALACARAARYGTLSRCSARTLTTEASASSSSAAPRPSKPKPGRYRTVRQDKTIYVRSWDDISSMPEFFAMLRGVEKRFGRVREFKLGRDPYIPTKYRNYFMIQFLEDDAYARIPATGTNIRVEVPVVRADRSGGIGLSDLANLLESQDKDEGLDTTGLYGQPISSAPHVNEAAEKQSTRVVELILQRTKKDEIDAVLPLTRTHTGFGVAFHEWGGFYSPSSSDERPVPSEMVDALTKWAEIARERPLRNANTAVDAQFRELLQGPDQPPDHTRRHTHAPTEEVGLGADSPSQPEPSEVQANEPSPDAQMEPPAVDSPVEPKETPAPAAPRLSRKEKILALARQNARTPFPEPNPPQADAEARKKEEEQKAKEETGSMREKLLRLMGGRWL